MKKFVLAPPLFLFAVFCALAPQARATFILDAEASPTTVSVGGTVTYTIAISNTFNLIQPIQVVSQFPSDAIVVSAANNFSPGLVSTNAGQVLFTVNTLPVGDTATFTLQLQPGSGASFTNTVTVSSSEDASVSTNVVVSLSSPGADLGMAASALPPTAVIGDFFNYTLTITNAGPSDASGVNIQSQLPAGLSFVSVTPTIPSSSLNNLLLLTPGTLPAGTNASYVVTLRAQTNGDFSFSTSVTATQNTDPDSTDNTISSSLHVIGLVTNTVAIVSASPMVFNYENALLEQIVVVSNLTSGLIDSVRVMATNLVAPNSLFNATGTNSGHPYVVVGSRLAVGATAAVTLQFFVTNRTVIDPGLVAVEGPSLVTLTVPSGTLIPATISHLRTGGYSSALLSFPTVVGRKYTLVAGDAIVSPLVTNLVTVTNIVTGTNGVLATNLVTQTNLVAGPTSVITNRIALFPPIVANSTHGQFIDSGPQVTGDGNRFYSVIEQP